MRDMVEFREVLNEWAIRQLTEKSLHTGPFEIVRVYLNYDQGFYSEMTPGDESLDIAIEFAHSDCEVKQWDDQPCTAKSWWSPDTKTTVQILNELLSIDEN
jgi:hypothetical protein